MSADNDIIKAAATLLLQSMCSGNSNVGRKNFTHGIVQMATGWDVYPALPSDERIFVSFADDSCIDTMAIQAVP